MTSSKLQREVTVGVLDVMNSGDWIIEKWSIKDKKDYTARHSNCGALGSTKGPGYELVIKDMTLKRNDAHEWRQSGEKVDTMRDAMDRFRRHE